MPFTHLLTRSPAIALVFGLTLPVSALAQPATGTLTVFVGNVRTAKGTVHVDICPQEKFLKDDCPYSGDAPAQLGVTKVVVHGLPPGRYATQAFLDENTNREVDRALFGIPKEGIGFSNDARISFGPPKWQDAVFAFGGGSESIRLDLRYFLGPKGPPKAR